MREKVAKKVAFCSLTNFAFALKHLRSLGNNIVLPRETLHSLTVPQEILCKTFAFSCNSVVFPEKNIVFCHKTIVPQRNFLFPCKCFLRFFFFLAKLLCFPSKLCFCSQNFCDMDVKTMKYIFSSLVPSGLCRNLALHLQLEC